MALTPFFPTYNTYHQTEKKYKQINCHSTVFAVYRNDSIIICGTDNDNYARTNFTVLHAKQGTAWIDGIKLFPCICSGFDLYAHLLCPVSVSIFCQIIFRDLCHDCFLIALPFRGNQGYFFELVSFD